MATATLFTEEIKMTFKESYKKAMIFESLNRKKELTLEEAVYVLQNESLLLSEGLFSKMGGLLDKGIKKVADTIIGAKDAIVEWAIKALGGQVVKKTDPTPFDGSKTLEVAMIAKTDKEGFFEKIAKMTGSAASKVKELYMKLEDMYEKIPVVGRVAKMIPKGWRTVVIAIIVAIVVTYLVWNSSQGQAPAAGGDAAGAAASAIDPKVGERAASLVDKLSGSNAHLKAYTDNPKGFVDKMMASFEKAGLKGDMDATKVVPGLKSDTGLSLRDWVESRLMAGATSAGIMDAQGAASAGFGSLDSKIYGN
jgi:hypothetical protein